MKQLNPPTLITPKSPYSHGLLVESGKSWLYVTGQVANHLALTALVVVGLANPKYLAEVDIVACR